MLSEVLVKIIKNENRRFSTDIDHFSISQVGRKFYVYAHPYDNNLRKKKIGTYPDYETAKANVDRILDFKLPSGDKPAE